MKYIVSILLLAFVFFANAQSNTTTYLMYERWHGQMIDESTGKPKKNFTQFMVRGTLKLDRIEAYSRNLNVIDNKVEKEIKWKAQSDQLNVKIKYQGRELRGKILTGIFIDRQTFEDSLVNFVLLPMGSGVEIKRLSGNYVKRSIGKSDTIRFGEIVGDGMHTGLQRTSFNFQSRSSFYREGGLTKYFGKEYFYLIYVGGMNQFLQPQKMPNVDEKLIFNMFHVTVDEPDSIMKTLIELEFLQ